LAPSEGSSRRRKPRRPPSPTTEGREAQLIAKAVDLAEEQLERGIASAQVITHYLKLGTTRERLEQERLKRENLLLDAKVQNLESAANVEKLYEEALKAMRDYQGQPDEQPYQDLH
jgi:hypothetical protein